MTACSQCSGYQAATHLERNQRRRRCGHRSIEHATEQRFLLSVVQQSAWPAALLYPDTIYFACNLAAPGVERAHAVASRLFLRAAPEPFSAVVSQIGLPVCGKLLLAYMRFCSTALSVAAVCSLTGVELL